MQGSGAKGEQRALEVNLGGFTGGQSGIRGAWPLQRQTVIAFYGGFAAVY